jgi:ankyrin repeat protein
MIELLLERGADVNATTTHGRTPLDYAVNPPLPLTKPENSEEIAAILKRAGGK